MSAGFEDVVAELEAADRFVLCTHEHPDGDALGSLAAMQLALTDLGKDAVSYMAADEFPLSYEYRFLELQRLVTEPPEDLDRRTVVFLDCGNIDRNPADASAATTSSKPSLMPRRRAAAARAGRRAPRCRRRRRSAAACA